MSPPQRRRDWASIPQTDALGQTLAASSHDAHDTGISSDHIDELSHGAFSLPPYHAVPDGNTFHIPPFRCLAATAGAGECHLSPLANVPMDQTRSSCQAPVMPPDGAFLLSSGLPGRHSGRPPVQFDLPIFSAQESAYALENGHAYPRNMPAPRGLPPTLDPSRLLHRQISMHVTQTDSASESEMEMDNAVESDRNRQLEADDGAGWGNHPDTIGLGTPKFYDTKLKGDMRDAAGVHVPVLIRARFVLKKKAAQQQNFWILYRRNYFGVQGSYTLEPLPNSSPKETLFLYREHHEPAPIQGLYMCMRGVVETEEGQEIKIVVFNAKRKPLHEGKDPPPLDPQRMKPLTEGSTKFYADSTGDRQDHLNVPMNHTFHRNQFRAATQNNGARRTEQQFYHVLMELKAEVMNHGVPEVFTVCSRMSEPLVVRGRCPLSFKTKDRDAHTRDPNRKGRKPPQDRNGNGSKRCSILQSHKGGHSKGVSRGLCNKTGGSSRRSTRASSSLPSVTYEPWSRGTNTNHPSPSQASHLNETAFEEIIPSLERKLLTFTREGWDGDPRSLDGQESV